MSTRAPMLGLARGIVTIASFGVRRSRRDDWLREWSSELSAVAACFRERGVNRVGVASRLLRHALIAFRDAASLRGQGPRDPHRLFSPPVDGRVRTFLRDLRFGLRQLTRSPGVTVTSIFTLAIGLGASAIMFGAINDILWQTLPFANADELVEIWARNPGRGGGETGLAVAEADAFRADLAGLEIASYGYSDNNLEAGDAVRRISTLHATPHLLSVLRVTPALGRGLAAEEVGPDAAPVALVSAGIWRELFGSNPTALGSEIRVDDDVYEIVGVLPADFWLLAEVDVLVPLRADPEDRTQRGFTTIARHDITTGREALRARLIPTMERLAGDYPASNAGLTDVLVGSLGSRLVDSGTRPALTLLFVGALLLLLICCVNVANLLLARAVARRREIAVRGALGAARGQLLSQLFAESLVLGLLGGLGGIGLCAIGTNAIASELPPDRYRAGLYSVGLDEIGFILAASIASAALFGLLPALRAARDDVVTGLRESALSGTPGRARVQKTLVVMETALALSLLIGAGLAVRSYLVVQSQSPGFDPDGLLTFRAAPPPDRVPDPATQVEFQRDLLASLEAIPGVENVGATTSLPMARQARTAYFTPEGRDFQEPHDRPWANVARVDDGYFEVMGMSLIRGRGFTGGDHADSDPVAVVTEQVARRTWPGESPIGKRLTFDPPDADESPVWRTVVGVVGTVRNNGLHNDAWDELYVPHAQLPAAGAATFVLRAQVDRATLVAAVRQTMRTATPGVAAYRIETMREVMAARFWGESITTRLLVACGLAALLLAVVGLAGVVGYTVARRTAEIGVRVALGARSADVVSLVVRQALVLVVTGCLLGLVGGYGLSRGMSFLLYGVDSSDSMTFIGVPLILLACSTVAAMWPAHRASRIDPARAFRAE